jgi:UDP-N-acetylmuramoylalanine--D-glutamate ligase
VLNWDNEITRGYAASTKGSVRYFSYSETPEEISRELQSRASETGSEASLEKDLFTVTLQNNVICIDEDGRRTEIIDAYDIRIPGAHNVENYMACVASVYGLCTSTDIADVAKTFGGVEHRLEFVLKHGGISFYNDSIASSPARTIAGLKSFDKKVILIAGGYDKQLSYKPLVEMFPTHVKVLVLMGQTKDKIRAEVDRLDTPVNFPVYEADTLEEAVKFAYMASQDGDIVLFSPASASFDMFKNFEQRGNAFKAIVNSLS